MQSQGGAPNSLVVTLPTHAANDIILLFVECNGTGIVTVADTTEVEGAIASGLTQGQVFWLRAGSSSETNPTVVYDANANHVTCFAVSVEGCITTGSPIDIAVTEAIAGAASLTIGGLTTNANDALVFVGVTNNANASATDYYSNWANSDLSNVTEIVDQTSTAGGGGGWGIITGGKATAGTIGNTTVDVSNSSGGGAFVIALKPAASGLTLSGSSATVTPTGETGELRLTPFSLADLLLWLDADAITGLVDTDPVTTWEDQSGRGNDVTGTGTTRPTYQTGELNSLPVVRFDGTDDVLSRADALGLTGNPAMTVFIVGKYTGVGTGDRIIQMGDSSSSPGTVVAFGLASDGAAMRFNNGAEEYGNAVFNAFAVNTWKRPASQQHDAAVFYQNGTEETATDSSNPTNTITLTDEVTWIGEGNAGSPSFWKGDVAEILIFASALSDTDREAVEQYLLEKWGFIAPLFLSGDVAVVSPAALLGTLSIGSTVLLAGSVADASLEALLGTLDLGAGLLLAGSTATVNVQALLGTLITEAILLLGASPTVTPEALTGAIVIGESIYLLGSTADSSMEALLGEVVINRVPGIYYYNGTNWVLISS